MMTHVTPRSRQNPWHHTTLSFVMSSDRTPSPVRSPVSALRSAVSPPRRMDRPSHVPISAALCVRDLSRRSSRLLGYMHHACTSVRESVRATRTPQRVVRSSRLRMLRRQLQSCVAPTRSRRLRCPPIHSQRPASARGLDTGGTLRRAHVARRDDARAPESPGRDRRPTQRRAA